MIRRAGTGLVVLLALAAAGPLAPAARADRDRAIAVAVFGLASAAAACAVVALVARSWQPAATGAAAALLASTLVPAAIDRRGDRDRIACRMLAELARGQRILAPLAWSLPPDLRLGPDIEPPVAPGDGEAAPAAWAGWCFAAALRAAPLPRGGLSEGCLAAVRAEVLAGLAGPRDAGGFTLGPRASRRLARRIALQGRARGMRAIASIQGRTRPPSPAAPPSSRLRSIPGRDRRRIRRGSARGSPAPAVPSSCAPRGRR